jgi:hypothetical protein
MRVYYVPVTWRCSQAGCGSTLKSIEGLVTTPEKAHQKNPTSTCTLIEPIEATIALSNTKASKTNAFNPFFFAKQYSKSCLGSFYGILNNNLNGCVF